MANKPLIIIPGPAVSELNIVDSNGNKTARAWPLNIDQQAVTNLLKSSLMKMMLLRKDAGFSDSVAKIAADTIDPLSVNPDGTKKHNIVAKQITKSYKDSTDAAKEVFNKAYPTDELIKTIGEENIYLFAYDMLGDFYSVAKELDGFINTVKAKTGAEKVNLLCISLGGVVLKAYLEEYADNGSIANVISVATLMNGSSLIADVFENNLALDDPKALLSLLGEKGESLSSLMGMLPPDAIENSITKCVNIARNSLLCNCTMMWACIPNNRFDAIYSALIEKGSELDKKVTKMHAYSMSLGSEIAALQEKGINFHWFCGHGVSLLPITKNADISSDGVADTSLASFGATVTTVDAEPDTDTCLFPENTCLIKGLSHLSAGKDTALNCMVANTLKKLAD